MKKTPECPDCGAAWSDHLCDALKGKPGPATLKYNLPREEPVEAVEEFDNDPVTEKIWPLGQFSFPYPPDGVT